MIRVRVAVSACTLAATGVVAGCGGGGGDSTVTSARSSTSTSTPTASTPTAPPRPLEDRWYVDANANDIPDFIETEIGADPTTDGCLPDRCQLPKGFSFDAVTKGQNTLLILDSSGSMAGPAGGGQSKIAAARSAIGQYVRATPKSLARFGLEVYGQKGSNRPSGKQVSCAGSEVLEPIGKLSRSGVTKALRRFDPTGYTPIAGALKKASTAFDGRQGGPNRIVLVTDGIETCGGDPVAAAKTLKRGGVKVTVDVVGFDIGRSSDRDKLKAIAKATGGKYTNAGDGSALYDYFNARVRQQARIIKAIDCLRGAAGAEVTCRESLYLKAATEITLKYLSPAQGAGEQAKVAALTQIRDRVQARVSSSTGEVRAQEQERIGRLQRELRRSQKATVKRP